MTLAFSNKKDKIESIVKAHNFTEQPELNLYKTNFLPIFEIRGLGELDQVTYPIVYEENEDDIDGF